MQALPSGAGSGLCACSGGGFNFCLQHAGASWRSVTQSTPGRRQCQAAVGKHSGCQACAVQQRCSWLTWTWSPVSPLLAAQPMPAQCETPTGIVSEFGSHEVPSKTSPLGQLSAGPLSRAETVRQRLGSLTGKLASKLHCAEVAGVCSASRHDQAKKQLPDLKKSVTLAFLRTLHPAKLLTQRWVSV